MARREVGRIDSILSSHQNPEDRSSVPPEVEIGTDVFVTERELFAEARGELDRLMFTSASATLDAKERLERMRSIAKNLR